MTGLRQGVVAVLLSASLVLTAAEAYAGVPRLCSQVGCSGGPDTCMIFTVRVGAVLSTLTCYTRIPATMN